MDTIVRGGGVLGDAAIRHTITTVDPMTLTRVQVSTDAAGVAGLDADSPAASLNANDVVVTTTGNNADGVRGVAG
ncbi:hypothetical protein [Bradyrhizobium retamae]|uniref:Uncharacterized protein n=1 Tax=Bradyrhizobium retamae TaxID=1300035 RepID=A0A0R3MJN5_9BRAD|nr:hypothetical protein [Bradyrhizobium retamae]KRR17725.1 hypothetical protein CQ13_35890 [Bradyrhizobium retamae]